MAPSFFLLLILFSSTQLFVSSRPITTAITATEEEDIHELLLKYGIPKGLLPNAVKSYTLSSNNAFFVELSHPCYVQFDSELVYYDSKISGKLSYGSVSDVTGIQAKKLFAWVSVNGMDVDSTSDMIEFHVGFLSEKLPAKQFETIRDCRNEGCHKTRSEIESM